MKETKNKYKATNVVLIPAPVPLCGGRGLRPKLGRSRYVKISAASRYFAASSRTGPAFPRGRRILLWRPRHLLSVSIWPLEGLVLTMTRVDRRPGALAFRSQSHPTSQVSGAAHTQRAGSSAPR